MNTKTANSQPHSDTSGELPQKDLGEGLSDDERVSRERDSSSNGQGARVTPGPEDEKRLKH